MCGQIEKELHMFVTCPCHEWTNRERVAHVCGSLINALFFFLNGTPMIYYICCEQEKENRLQSEI